MAGSPEPVTFLRSSLLLGTSGSGSFCRRDQQLLASSLAHSLDQTERDLILDALPLVREAAVRRERWVSASAPWLQARPLA